MDDEHIFRSGSTTYFWSSKFFPKSIRDDIFKLYSFVRVTDDFVDAMPPDEKSFRHIQKRWRTLKKSLAKGVAKSSDSVSERVLANIAYIVHRYDCDPGWVDDFLRSMDMDLKGRKYDSLDDTLDYVYGSAEVVGLLMAKLLGLDKTKKARADVVKQVEKDVMYYARMQGRAMQYINFIRDINEDYERGRCYFPKEDLVMFGLKDLSPHEAARKPAEFREFIEYQVGRYREWQREANKGFRYIPKRQRIAIRTAVDMYNWTARQLVDDPRLIYQKIIKPSRRRVLRQGVKRTLYG